MKKETKQKPVYGIASNVRYMISLASKLYKSVLVLAVIQIVLGVLTNLLELFAAAGSLARGGGSSQSSRTSRSNCNFCVGTDFSRGGNRVCGYEYFEWQNFCQNIFG